MAVPKENTYNRAAGSGVILAGSMPIKRGMWNVYETTNPSIGGFERCFWLECADQYMYDSKIKEDFLEEFSFFLDDNFFDNIILLDFSHIRVMGGVTNMDGKCYAGRSYRNEKARNKKKKPKWPDIYLTTGFELRLCEKDATTFLTLWPGYEPKSK